MTTKIERRIKIKYRVRNKLSGTSERPRMTVFRSNKQIYVQIVDDSIGKTLVAASSLGLTEKIAKKEQASKVGEIIAKKAQEKGSKIIQIATDCVYSGDKGHYIETDPQDALDVYGKTKSLGEVYSPNVFHLRCSIIGPEPKEFKSLLEWFLGQSTNTRVNGFTNHRWNGLTTLHFAKICYGIITNDIQLFHLQHVVPNGEVTKFEILKFFSKIFNRRDISITPFETEISIDRTISTINDGLNLHLWKAAGYVLPPSVPEMIEELAKYDYSFHIPSINEHR